MQRARGVIKDTRSARMIVPDVGADFIFAIKAFDDHAVGMGQDKHLIPAAMAKCGQVDALFPGWAGNGSDVANLLLLTVLQSWQRRAAQREVALRRTLKGSLSARWSGTRVKRRCIFLARVG